MAKAKRSSMYAITVTTGGGVFVEGGKQMQCYTLDAEHKPFTTVTAAREYFEKCILAQYDANQDVTVMISSITEVQNAVRQVRVAFTPVDLGALAGAPEVVKPQYASDTAEPVRGAPETAVTTDAAPEAEQEADGTGEAAEETPPWGAIGEPVPAGAISATPEAPAEPEVPKHEVPVAQGVSLVAIFSALRSSPESAFVVDASTSKILIANAANPGTQSPATMLAALRNIAATPANVIDLKAATAATTDANAVALMSRAKMGTVMQRVIRQETYEDATLVIACEDALIKAVADSSGSVTIGDTAK